MIRDIVLHCENYGISGIGLLFVRSKILVLLGTLPAIFQLLYQFSLDLRHIQ